MFTGIVIDELYPIPWQQLYFLSVTLQRKCELACVKRVSHIHIPFCLCKMSSLGRIKHGRVNVHGRTSFHGVEAPVITSFPAVKPFPAELTLLAKVSRCERDLFGSVAHALSSCHVIFRFVCFQFHFWPNNCFQHAAFTLFLRDGESPHVGIRRGFCWTLPLERC